ncbi:GIY-YIG nuclease family protein [Rhodocaloribacter litoris]|uniref:GIY-YIG nuclease family protein n=1 Tax=Rhodocaloribacter litoris TaxID=2558931 RepID=UPI0014223C4D|nr:GIY-YIG nuclease family protein [Rhodocaloribacter litoris]
MDCHVYVRQSASSGRLYIGHTYNLERRLAEHNAGQTPAAIMFKRFPFDAIPSLQGVLSRPANTGLADSSAPRRC